MSSASRRPSRGWGPAGGGEPMNIPVHVRTIRVEAVEAGPGELEVTGILLARTIYGR